MMAIKKPRFFKSNLFLLLISIIVSLMLIEVGARIWLHHIASPEQFFKYALYSEFKAHDFRFSPHHYLNYYLTPNYTSGLTKHNSLGYRGDEFPVNKPEGIYRIVALGGSTTYTIRVEDNKKTFPDQLEKTLKEKYGYEHVEVINAGVGGYNSWESLVNLEFRVLDLEPDLIVIYHGTNDIHSRLVQPSAYRGDNSGQRKQWEPTRIHLIERSCLLRILLRKMGLTHQIGLGSYVNGPNFIGEASILADAGDSYDPKDMLLKNIPIYFRRNLINMTAIAKANDIDVLLATWAYTLYFKDYISSEHYQLGIIENNQVVKEVANQSKVHLFDFAEKMSKEKKYWADGRHVNEEGALLKACLFADYIHNVELIPNKKSQENK